MKWAAAIAALIVALAWIFARGVGDGNTNDATPRPDHPSAAAPPTTHPATPPATPTSTSTSEITLGGSSDSTDTPTPQRTPVQAAPIVIGEASFVRGQSLELPPEIETLIAELYSGLDEDVWANADETQREQLEELCRYAKTRVSLLCARKRRRWAQVAFDQIGPSPERNVQLQILPGDDPELDRATERIWLETKRSMERIEAFAAGLEAAE